MPTYIALILVNDFGYKTKLRRMPSKGLSDTLLFWRIGPFENDIQARRFIYETRPHRASTTSLTQPLRDAYEYLNRTLFDRAPDAARHLLAARLRAILDVDRRLGYNIHIENA